MTKKYFHLFIPIEAILDNRLSRLTSQSFVKFVISQIRMSWSERSDVPPLRTTSRTILSERLNPKSISSLSDWRECHSSQIATQTQHIRHNTIASIAHFLHIQLHSQSLNNWYFNFNFLCDVKNSISHSFQENNWNLQKMEKRSKKLLSPIGPTLRGFR